MKLARQSILLHEQDVTATAGRFAPANLVDWSWADEVTFQIRVNSVSGSPTTWDLSAKFQVGMKDTVGNGWSAPEWSDLDAATAPVIIVGGVGFYNAAAAETPPTAGAPGTIHRNGVAFPSRHQRTVRNFGGLVRVILQPTFTGGTSPKVNCTVVAIAKG